MVKEITSYSPFTGGIYDGPIAGEDMRYEDMFLSSKLAEVHVSPQHLTAARQGLATELVDAQVSVPKYTFVLSASMRQATREVAAEKAAKRALWAGTMTPAQAMSYQMRQLGADADSSISHVRTIPRIPKILGVPPSIYYLEQMFSNQPVEKLDARVAEQDGISIELQKGPTERTSTDKTEYTEHRFHLKRNSLGLVWSSESMMRADADIRSIDYRNAAIAKARARELLALVEFSKLSTSEELTIKDANTKASDVSIPRSLNNPVEDLAKIIADFNTERSANVTHFAWNPVDFVNFCSNFWVMTSSLLGPSYQGYGVVQMPKMPGLTAVISPMMPRGKIYAVDKSQVFCGEGPFTTEVERDAAIYSDRAYLHDFVQFLIPNKKRFGLKINYTLPSGVKAGTEITSIKQAQQLAGPKAVLASETHVDGTFE